VCGCACVCMCVGVCVGGGGGVHGCSAQPALIPYARVNKVCCYVVVFQNSVVMFLLSVCVSACGWMYVWVYVWVGGCRVD
jgi:hypothetical protein